MIDINAEAIKMHEAYLAGMSGEDFTNQFKVEHPECTGEEFIAICQVCAKIGLEHIQEEVAALQAAANDNTDAQL